MYNFPLVHGKQNKKSHKIALPRNAATIEIICSLGRVNIGTELVGGRWYGVDGSQPPCCIQYIDNFNNAPVS